MESVRGPGKHTLAIRAFLASRRTSSILHMSRYSVAQLETLPPIPCPCGTARRAFGDSEGVSLSVHLTEISTDARTHYHKRLTETYVVVEGEGWLELDGERVPLKPLTAVTIRPGCRHRAVGKLKLLNFVVPAFDPEDEWFD
jgi:mannose-6-phosphate isomerase-like protein (cupin superfamily)